MPPASAWRAGLGAWIEPGGARFRVWAPERRAVDLVLEGPGVRSVQALERGRDGHFGGFVAGAGAGQRYRYRLDGEGPYPDPASRFQPEGVHGPSEIVDPAGFAWSDAGWSGMPLDDLIVYELHVGAFTPAGTFAAVSERLPYLRDLGVTALELMPLGDFPGARNWGYDGVALFAPARCYGGPDDLRRLVDTAHRHGLGVLLDVVYNHFGPDGAYHGLFSRRYHDRRRRTPWGDALRLEGRDSAHVRDFFFENAAHWVGEYHFDGLRLDATHAFVEKGPRFFLAELRERLQAAFPARPPLLIAEDHRNLAHMVRPASAGGFGLDAVWADDFHHQVRRGLAGDSDGYYRDFSGSLSDLAETVRKGWFFCGQRSEHLGGPRGSDPHGLGPRRFVVCLQNHDQVGNRALGERLNQQIGPAAWRAASVLLLLSPLTPLLFMGQEWAAGTPFQFFTDHAPELGRLVTEGRRREFARFAAFSDPQARERIPDPQAASTFERSRLAWEELQEPAHARVLALYRALLALRRGQPALAAPDWEGFEAVAVEPGGLLLGRRAADGTRYVAALRMQGAGPLMTERLALNRGAPARPWELLLSTEDPAYCDDPRPIEADLGAAAPALHFARPGAAVLRTPAGG